MTLEDREHLAGDFARAQVALETQFGRQAELTVHRAAHLARDADGGTLPALFRAFGRHFPLAGDIPLAAAVFRNLRGLPVAAVSAFAAVALRHPDGFDRLRRPSLAARCPILRVALDQVAFRPVQGLEDLHDFRPAHLPALGGHPLAQQLGQGGDLIHFSQPLAIESLGQLAASPGRLARLDHARPELRGVQSEQLPGAERS